VTASSLQGAVGESDALHVVPVGDDIEHATTGAPCPCRPDVTTVAAADGSEALMVVHRIILWPLLAAASERAAPRLLSCGLCFEEDGEEVHPHPECPL
jgi:hypothetical protein